MKSEDIAIIERELGLTVPDDLREFLTSERDGFDPDAVAVSDEPCAIVEMTIKYRNGFAGLPPWPQTWIYLGDEADACPHGIDCASGRVFKLHKGNAQRKALKHYESFAAYQAAARENLMKCDRSDPAAHGRKMTLAMYGPLLAALIAIFVLLPLVAYSLRSLLRWLF